MWSYTHRREDSNILLSDEMRRTFTIDSTQEDDRKNFLHCKHSIESIINPVQFAIPCFHNEKLNLNKIWNSIRGVDWPTKVPNSLDELNSLPSWILQEMKNLHNCLEDFQNKIIFQEIQNSILVESLDLARDGHHFDLITADWVAARASSCLI
jgi:hypothetical protein